VNAEGVRECTLAELSAKGRLVVHGNHRPILIVYHGERVFALDNRCPHMGFPLDRGSVEDGILTCHWRHARFDLESGCTFDLSADDTPTFPVEVRDGEVWAKTTFSHVDPATHWRQRDSGALAATTSACRCGRGLRVIIRAPDRPKGGTSVVPTMSLVPATPDDYRRIAERRLPRFLFDFIDGGAFDEVTLQRNTEDFRKIAVRQKVMCDVAKVDVSGEMLGERFGMPLALAPLGLAGMYARRGETQAKRAADAAGLPFVLSTVSICSMEEVARVSGRPFWFQLYMLRDRGVVQEILDRAWGVGVRVLVFTVDLAVTGVRYRDMRNGGAGGATRIGRLRAGPLSYISHPAWLWDVAINGKPHVFGNLSKYVPKATNPAEFMAWVASQFDASVTWSDIEWLRGIWKGKLIIKGVLSAADSLAAAKAGADAIVVSNHGGRQLDGVLSSIAVLPKVAAAIDGATEIFVDGGLRSGLDVVRALALGAKGTMIGRPWAFAVAARGEAGLSALLRSFAAEIRVAMALTGITQTLDIGPELLEPL